MHDVGHPPFGHAGEVALRELMAEHGGFEHNLQGLRVVDTLELRYPGYSGLNLSWEVREGIAKHSKEWDPDRPTAAFAEFSQGRWPSLEAQVVDVADEIAYNAHDIDDGLTAGMIQLEALQSLRIWSEITRSRPAAWRRLTLEQAKYQGVRGLINAQVEDLLETVEQRVQAWNIQTPADVRDTGPRLATLSPTMEALNRELREFLMAHVYRNYRVRRMWNKAKRVVEEIFHSYLAAPEQLPPHAYQRLQHETAPRVVCDYIAGMTDREALDEHSRLFDPRLTT